MNLHSELPSTGTADPLHGRKLKVGIISPYSFETPGGVQLHIRDLAQQLLALGHRVEVLAPGRRTEDMPLWVHTTGSSFSIPYNGSVAHLSYFGVAGRLTRRWVRQGHFDILHLHEPEVPSLSHKPLIPGFSPCPYVATFHAAFDSYPLALKIAKPYLRANLSNIKEGICVSQSAFDTASHYLSDDIGLRIIPNGIDTGFFARAKSKPEWQGTSERPTIGFLGRMAEERKGFRVFAQAALHILSTRPGARFLCAGDGEEEARRIARSVSPSLENHLEFLGRISDEDKASLYKSLDVYVAPQIGGESFGIVLVEAMAAGCPVVASDLPAFLAVSQKGTSMLHFGVGDSVACAEQVALVLSDMDLKGSLGRLGQERSTCYDWKLVTEQILSVYGETLQQSDETLSS